MKLEAQRRESIPNTSTSPQTAVQETEVRNQAASRDDPAHDIMANLFWDHSSAFASMIPSVDDISALAQLDHDMVAEAFTGFQTSTPPVIGKDNQRVPSPSPLEGPLEVSCAKTVSLQN